VGSHTAAALAAAGYELRLFVRNPDKARSVLRVQGLELPEHVVGDVTDAAASREALAGCDAVVHSAGVVALERHRAEEVLSTNLAGVRNVVGQAAEAGIDPIVFVSSVGAMFQPMVPVTPDSPVIEGQDAYALSKSQCERYVRELQAAGAPILTTYPTAVIGPDDPGISGSNRAILTLMRDVFPMTSSGFQAVDVRDVARVHALLIERSGTSGRYLAGGHYIAWPELAELLTRVSGNPLRRVPLPGWSMRLGGVICDVIKRFVDFEFPMTKEGMAFATQWAPADSSKTCAELGIDFRDPAETLRDTISWMHRAGHLDARHAGRLTDWPRRETVPENAIRLTIAVDGVHHQLESVVLVQVEPHVAGAGGTEHQRVHLLHAIDLLRTAGAAHQIVRPGQIAMDLQSMIVTAHVERRHQRPRRPVHRRYRARVPRVRGVGARYPELS
jgi:nucleoside-diphosphate-sugar epimerase